MSAVNMIVVLSALTATAMMLQGCGGGGNTPAPAPMPAPGTFKLVSQTFKGTVTTNMSIPGAPSSDTTVEILVDMEAVRYRTNTQAVVKVSTPDLNMTSTVHAAMIFDASTKRATFYTDTQVTGNSTPIPPRPATCDYFEFPNMVAVDAVKKCVQDFPLSGPPEDTKDGLKKFHMNLPVPKSEGAADEVVYTDKDFVMKKMIMDISTIVPGHPPMGIHEEMIDMDSKAGAPDSREFEVPLEWGTCTKAALPPIPTSNNPVLASFMKCVGMGASQASVTV